MEKKLFYKLFAAFFMGVLITRLIKEGKDVFSFSFVEVFFHLLYIVAFDKDDALPMINERLGT